MREVLFEATHVGRAVRDWRHLVTLMEETASDFESAPAGVLPSRVQPTGVAFLQAWSMYAGEAGVEAGRFVSSLEQTIADFTCIEEGAVEQFTAMAACFDSSTPSGSLLSSRLGPLQ
jgi:hypothetical protein